jgi:hypothetical protein
LEELVVHLKIYCSQANLQQLHDGFDLQDGLFFQCIIVVELISDDLQSFVDWNIGEKTDNVKANEGV